MVEGIEDVLAESTGEAARSLVDLHSLCHTKFKGVQEWNRLAGDRWFQSGCDRRDLGEPMGRLDDRDAGLFDVLEYLECLKGVRFLGTSGEDPLDDDARVDHDRGHGRP
jgi:hypothetical protein